MKETCELAEWVAGTGYDDLPPEVVEAVRVYILDDLASGFAGAHLPWTEMVAGMVSETSVGACSVFGRANTTSAPGAALVNGVAIGGFETDHPFTAGSCHPSGAVFPAVLAPAETAFLDGKSFLTAIATGYECLCRVGLAATRAVEDERGFHGPGTNAPIGAAIGAAKAMGLDAGLIVNAIGIAVSHGGGLLEFHREGAMTKRLHLGRGSQVGLESALLAQRGFTGPSTGLEGGHGFLHVYSPSPRVEELLKDLGGQYRLMDVTVKAFPCHISFHAVIDAIVRFKQTHSLDPAQISAVEIVGEARMMAERFGARSVSTLMGAQYSMPWSVALALCHDAANPDAWTETSLQDALVVRLAGDVRLRRERPSDPGAIAEVIVEAGGKRHVLTATGWKGAPGNPCDYSDIAVKFTHYADGVIPDVRIQEVVERVARLESEPDVAVIANLIRG